MYLILHKSWNIHVWAFYYKHKQRNAFMYGRNRPFWPALAILARIHKEELPVKMIQWNSLYNINGKTIFNQCCCAESCYGKRNAVARYKQISHITIMIYPGANVLYKHFEFSIGSLLTAKSCFVWFLWYYKELFLFLHLFFSHGNLILYTHQSSTYR